MTHCSAMLSCALQFKPLHFFCLRSRFGFFHWVSLVSGLLGRASPTLLVKQVQRVPGLRADR